MTGREMERAQGGPVSPEEVDRARLPANLFGTTDPDAILERTRELSGALARALRDRDLARRYGDGRRHFIHIEGWQLVGSFLGVSARVTWSRPLEDGSGWEARAEAVSIDGRVLGAGEGMCQRSEPGRRRQSEHALRAMAQVRARRGALRSVLAFVPAIGGLDFSDPDASATREQVVALHAIASARGWTHEQSHRRAGVESFNDLDRGRAAELIDSWAPEGEVLGAEESPGEPAEGEDPRAGPGEAEDGTPTFSGGGEDRGPDPLDALSIEELWERAIVLYGSRLQVLQAHLRTFRPEGGTSRDRVTPAELRTLIRDAESRGPGHRSPGSPRERDRDPRGSGDRHDPR